MWVKHRESQNKYLSPCQDELKIRSCQARREKSQKKIIFVLNETVYWALKSLHMCIIFAASGFHGSCSLIWWEYGGKKQINFSQRLRRSNNMQFAADADLYNSDAFNVKQWDVYNSRADTDIQWSKYQSSLGSTNRARFQNGTLEIRNQILVVK